MDELINELFANKETVDKSTIENWIKSHKIVSLKSGDYVDKYKLQKAENKNKELEEQISSFKSANDDNLKKLEELSKNSALSDDLKKQLETQKTDYENRIKELENKHKEMSLDNIISTKLLSYNPIQTSIGLIKGLIDKDKLIEKNGELIGLDEQIKSIMSEHSNLFNASNTPKIATNDKNINGGKMSNERPTDVKELANYLVNLKKTDPERYEQERKELNF